MGGRSSEPRRSPLSQLSANSPRFSPPTSFGKAPGTRSTGDAGKKHSHGALRTVSTGLGRSAPLASAPREWSAEDTPQRAQRTWLNINEVLSPASPSPRAATPIDGPDREQIDGPDVSPLRTSTASPDSSPSSPGGIPDDPRPPPPPEEPWEDDEEEAPTPPPPSPAPVAGPRDEAAAAAGKAAPPATPASGVRGVEGAYIVRGGARRDSYSSTLLAPAAGRGTAYPSYSASELLHIGGGAQRGALAGSAGADRVAALQLRVDSLEGQLRAMGARVAQLSDVEARLASAELALATHKDKPRRGILFPFRKRPFEVRL